MNFIMFQFLTMGLVVAIFMVAKNLLEDRHLGYIWGQLLSNNNWRAGLLFVLAMVLTLEALIVYTVYGFPWSPLFVKSQEVYQRLPDLWQSGTAIADRLLGEEYFQKISPQKQSKPLDQGTSWWWLSASAIAWLVTIIYLPLSFRDEIGGFFRRLRLLDSESVREEGPVDENSSRRPDSQAPRGILGWFWYLFDEFIVEGIIGLFKKIEEFNVMDRNNLFVVFFASVVALWLLGVSPIVAIAVIILIGCLGVVAEVAEPDNALKRYTKRYAKIILTTVVAILVTALVSLVLAVPFVKVAVEVVTGDVLSNLAVDQIEQLRLMSSVILILSSLVAYVIVYGGDRANKWRKLVVALLVVVFSLAFWQVRMRELPLGQRLTKSISVTLAKESVQLGHLNQEVKKVYLADCNTAKKNFTSITAQDQILKSGLKVKVKLTSPVVMYAEQGFINVLLADDQGEFSLDPSDSGVWLPVEVVTLGQQTTPKVVVASTQPVQLSPAVATVKPVVVSAIVAEPELLAPSPKLVVEKNSNTITVTTGQWVTTGIATDLGDRVELGRFSTIDDVSRLEARISGGSIPRDLSAQQTSDGRWSAVLEFNTGGSNLNRHQIELRLKYGLPLKVAIQKI